MKPKLIISVAESNKIIKWLNRTQTRYLFLHDYDIQSPGYIILVNDLPSIVDTISFTIELSQIRENISLYINLFSKLKLRKFNKLYLILASDSDSGLKLPDLRNTVKYQLLPEINSLIINTEIQILYIQDDFRGELKKPTRDFFAACINNSNVHTLDLTNCHVRLDQRKSILNMAYNSASLLHNVFFNCNTFHKQLFLFNFIKSLEFNPIEYLNFSDVRWCNYTMNDFFKILPKTNIQYLSINLFNNSKINDDMITNLSNSKVEHFELQTVDSCKSFVFFELENLKTKILKIESFYFPIDLFNNNNVGLYHLTHIHIDTNRINESELKSLMIILSNSQIRSAMLFYPLSMIYWDIISEYLPKCKNLIEFGYIVKFISNCIKKIAYKNRHILRLSNYPIFVIYG